MRSVQTYGPAQCKLVITVSCYLVHGWHRDPTSGCADGWKPLWDKKSDRSPFSIRLNLSPLDPYARPKSVINCDVNWERVHIYPAALWRVIQLQTESGACVHVCVCVCVHVCVCVRAPGRVTHPSKSVRLPGHWMCPVVRPISMTTLACLWETAVSQVEGMKRGFT